MRYKTNAKPLAAFVQRKGGINECAERFARWLGRPGRRSGVERFPGWRRGAVAHVIAYSAVDRRAPAMRPGLNFPKPERPPPATELLDVRLAQPIHC